MTSLTKNKSIDELFTLLSESSRMERICQADRDAILIAIFKKQQETIEKNQITIKEQKELIENLWAWAEEKDEQMFPQYSDEDEELRLRAYREWEEGGREAKYPEEGDHATTTRRLQGDSSKYIDYSNFKLCDEYCGEREGFTYFHETNGPGYYALKMPLVWSPRIYS